MEGGKDLLLPQAHTAVAAYMQFQLAGNNELNAWQLAIKDVSRRNRITATY